MSQGILIHERPMAPMEQRFVLTGDAQRPRLVSGLDHEFILSSLARRPQPHRVPSSFAASVWETVRVLDEIMRFSAKNQSCVARPIRDDWNRALVVLPFDRKWFWQRADTLLETCDLLEVRVYRAEGLIKLEVFIEHDSYGIIDCEDDVTTSIAFDKALTHAEYVELLSTKFFEEAELTPVVATPVSLPVDDAATKIVAELKTVAEPGICKTSISMNMKQSSGMDRVLVRKVADAMGGISPLISGMFSDPVQQPGLL